ncbi:DUF6702 family protein [Flavimarina sp. Hel_I_48]|uniref:DUF6702 family protein n=1 Tax=Flavimarina sp. Hel_I_48 TaxID=1392488 RepID=UPI001F1352F2|nr:DUF6702 family protein [Flavimarina sp. Hel_I_48]
MLGLIGLMGISTAWHKFYLSVTQVDFIPKEQSVQVTTRLFYDDLEKALQERFDSGIKVEKSYDQKKLDTYINKYIQQKLKITINKEQVKMNYLGHKDENDYVVCFIEIKDINTIKSMEIENTLLMDVFPAQKNVVHAQVGETRKSFMLTASKDSAMLNLDE